MAVDKSLMAARGPLWHKEDRKANRIPKGLHGVDRDSTWAFSKHHGWVQGYSYEVVTTAAKEGTVLPLLASGRISRFCPAVRALGLSRMSYTTGTSPARSARRLRRRGRYWL